MVRLVYDDTHYQGNRRVIINNHFDIDVFIMRNSLAVRIVINSHETFIGNRGKA